MTLIGGSLAIAKDLLQLDKDEGPSESKKDLQAKGSVDHDEN